MSLTINDCLKIGIMKEAKVIAGRGGLSRLVTGVTVQDIEIEKWGSSNTIYGGEIILSSLKFVRNSTSKQKNLIRSLSKLNVSGLVVFYLGITIPEISEEIIETANELDFPVIAFPKDRNDYAYIDVINIITNELMKEKIQEYHLLHEILKNKNKSVLKDESFSNLVNIIGDIFEIECVVVNTLFEVIGMSTKLPDQEINNIVGEKKKQFLWKIDNNQTEQIYPIDNDGEVLGYLIIINPKSYELDKVNRLLEALKYFSRVFPIERSKLEYENEHLLNLINNSNYNIRRGYLIPSDEIEFIMVIKFLNLEITENLFIKIYNLLKSLFLRYNILCNLGVYDDAVVLICKRINKKNPLLDTGDINVVLMRMDPFISSQFSKNFKIGYLNYYDKDDSNYDFKESVEFIIKNIQLLGHLFPNKKVYNEKMLFLAQVMCNSFPSPLDNYFKRYINLFSGGNDYDEVLLKTLQTFILDWNGDLELTSKDMYIHENTLRYRLKAIEDRTGLYFEDSIDTIVLTIISLLTRRYNIKD